MIDGNPGYDEILSHHLSETMKAEFAESVPIAIRRERATASGLRSLGKRSRTRLRPTFDGFACYGQTQNNIREFEFFDSICAPIGLSVSKANYKFAEQQPAWKPTPAQIEAGEAIKRNIEHFYWFRDQITPGLVRQFNIYSTTFYTYLMAFTSPGAVWPKALVIANDHSPTPVALSMVLKGLGIPRIYLQHAEVSEAFPPLDFEYSVLRNDRSLKTYSSIGSGHGATYVIPRFVDPPAVDRLATPLEEPVTVVIYPTARFLGAELRQLVGRLLGNPLVRKVAVKEHPNAAIRVLDWVPDDRLQLLKDIPSDPHVAVVGNSSIAVELISRGIPVYQNFGFDPVARDYYGMVRAGLVPEVTSECLERRFWEPYVLDKAWRRSFSKWVPTTADNSADREAFRQAMERVAQNVPVARHISLPKSLARAGETRRLGAMWIMPSSSNVVAHVSATLLRVSPFLHVRLRRAWKRINGVQDRKVAPNGWAAINEKQIKLVALILSRTRDPLAWLGANQKLGVFSPMVVIGAVERLLRRRDVSVSKLFQERSDSDPVSLIHAWLELKRSERSNLPMTPERLGRIIERIGAARDVRLKRAMEEALLPVLINYGSLTQLVRQLDNGTIPWRQITLTYKISILKRLASIPAEKERADGLRSQMLLSASDFEKLQIANTEFFAGSPPEGWSHAHAERMFMAVAPEPIRTQYASKVHPVFEALRPRMTLMDVRANPQQRAAFLSRVRSALVNLEGFSCIRLSDGEGFLFSDVGYFGHDDSLNRERHWWGVELSDDQRIAIRRDARRAVSDADIVGLPSVFRFIRDTYGKTQSLVSSVQGRGLLSCLHGVGELVRSESVAFSEDKFNVGLFSRVDVVIDLAAAARKLVIVSSIQPKSLPQGLREFPRIDHISLPTHNNTKSNDTYVQGNLSFPAVYPDLLEEFERKVGPGTLVLVAGGLIGKIFVGRAKERGAVAIDIGHVIDDWVTSRLTTLR